MSDKIDSAVNLLLEAEPRLRFEEKGSWSNRVFFDAYLLDTEKNWIDKELNRSLAASATLEVYTSEEFCAEVSSIYTEIRGRGYGRELLNHIISRCREKGIKTLYAYVERYNFESFDMFRMSGFVIRFQKREGYSLVREL